MTPPAPAPAILREKIVVVTGGAGLIGRQFCAAIASHGGTAVVADVQFEAAQGVAQEIAARHPGGAIAAAVDITDPESIRALISQVNEQCGRIDALVNNAYPRNENYGRRFEDVTFADFCENTGLHVGGYFLASQQFAAYFTQQGHGNIVNMSSIYGVIAPRFSVYDGTSMTMPVEYAAIKAAVNHLTRYMAAYFKGRGIRVNALSPGGIADRQPESFLAAYQAHCAGKGMLDPQDIVPALVFLLSDGSRHVNGQNLLVDDGFTL
jgi:NAD(P)-dependent dehydrogenase (short-subunit alcohol dehydrogenase family)